MALTPTLDPYEKYRKTATADVSPPLPGTSPTSAAATGTATAAAGFNPARLNRNALKAGRNENVQQLTDRVLDRDSLLMQQARATAAQGAQARGIMNSSMAQGAAMDEMARVAVPIASQQANINANANQRGFDRGQDIYLQKDQQKFQTKTQIRDQGFQRGMQDDQQKFQTNSQIRDIKAQKWSQTSARTWEARQASLNRALEERMARFDASTRQSILDDEQQFQRTMFDRETDFQQRMAQMEMSENQRQQVSAMADNANSLYQNSVVNILQNPDMDAKSRQQALSDTRSTYVAQIQMVEDLYGVKLNYSGLPTPTAPRTRKDRRLDDDRDEIGTLTRRYGGSYADRERYNDQTGSWPMDDPAAYEAWLRKKYGAPQ